MIPYLRSKPRHSVSIGLGMRPRTQRDVRWDILYPAVQRLYGRNSIARACIDCYLAGKPLCECLLDGIWAAREIQETLNSQYGISLFSEVSTTSDLQIRLVTEIDRLLLIESEAIKKQKLRLG